MTVAQAVANARRRTTIRREDQRRPPELQSGFTRSKPKQHTSHQRLTAQAKPEPLDFDSALSQLSRRQTSAHAATVGPNQPRYQVLEPRSPTERSRGQGRLVAEFHTLDLALQFARDQMDHARPVIVVDGQRGRRLPLDVLLELD